MEECLFCKIIRGEIPSKTIYEDERVKVFLDITPKVNGDLLIIPKKHTENILTIDNETLLYIVKIIKEKIYPLLKEKLDAKGLTIIQNNEKIQEIKHFHFHVTPRKEDKDLEIKSYESLLKDLEEVYNILTK